MYSPKYDFVEILEVNTRISENYNFCTNISKLIKKLEILKLNTPKQTRFAWVPRWK